MFLSSCEASTFNVAFSRLMCIPSTITRKKSQDALMSAVSYEACLTTLPHLKPIPYMIYAPKFPVRGVAGIEGHNNFPLSRPFSFKRPSRALSSGQKTVELSAQAPSPDIPHDTKKGPISVGGGRGG